MESKEELKVSQQEVIPHVSHITKEIIHTVDIGPKLSGLLTVAGFAIMVIYIINKIRGG